MSQATNAPTTTVPMQIEYARAHDTALAPIIRGIAFSAMGYGVILVSSFCAQLMGLLAPRTTINFGSMRNISGVVIESSIGVVGVIMIVAAAGILSWRRWSLLTIVICSAVVIAMIMSARALSFFRVGSTGSVQPMAVQLSLGLSILSYGLMTSIYPGLLIWFFTRRPVRALFGSGNSSISR